MRHHQAGGTKIQYLQDAWSGFVRYAHQEWQTGGASGQHQQIKCVAIERRVLGVDHRERQAGAAEYLDYLRMRGLDEGAGGHAGAQGRLQVHVVRLISAAAPAPGA